MNKILRKLHFHSVFVFVCIALVLSLLPRTSSAQTGYDEELTQFAAETRSLMLRAERLNLRDQLTQRDIQVALFDLMKRLHRLEEEAMATNVELTKRGSASDRKLLLVASIAKALDLAQSLTGYYLETRDKLFLTQASIASSSARAMQAALR